MEINAGSHYRTALSPFQGQVGPHNFHSLNFSIIDFPSLRRSFPFCFLFFLLCGLVYTLAAHHMMYRSVQCGQYQHSTEQKRPTRTAGRRTRNARQFGEHGMILTYI